MVLLLKKLKKNPRVLTGLVASLAQQMGGAPPGGEFEEEGSDDEDPEHDHDHDHGHDHGHDHFHPPGQGHVHLDLSEEDNAAIAHLMDMGSPERLLSRLILLVTRTSSLLLISSLTAEACSKS